MQNGIYICGKFSTSVISADKNESVKASFTELLFFHYLVLNQTQDDLNLEIFWEQFCM